MNSINVINIYPWSGMWVFDDPSVGLVREPFVAGADTLIDVLSAGRDNVVVTFSAVKFPGHTLTLEKVDKEVDGTNGTDYICPQLANHKLWLCPALLCYFAFPPDTIYLNYH